MAFPAECNEFPPLGFQTFKPKATCGNQVFSMFTPAELRHTVTQVLDPFAINGGDMFKGTFMLLASLGQFGEVIEGRLRKFETNTALVLFVGLFLDAEPANEKWE